MKNTFILSVLLIAALPAYAVELPATGLPVSEPLATTTFGEPAASSYQKVARHSAEGRLRQELELPPSDVFIVDEASADDEVELRLPEEELPESDIPLTLNSKVEYFISYFQSSGKKAFSKWLSRSERYIPMMKEVLKKEGLPEDLVYLAMIESGFSPHAYSVASAVGPWQFISGTGKRYSLRIDSWVDERRDPLKSTVAAALYLKELYSLFNKNWYLAAAGYNAGENKILRAIDMYKTRDFWEMSQGSYLKRETKDYVPKLVAAAIIAKDPAKYGFADIAYLPPIEFDTVSVTGKTDLEVAAKICGVPEKTIRDLNPELRRWCTPPHYENYQLKIPKGKKAVFEVEYAKIPEDQLFKDRAVYTRYRVKRKESLASIARKFGTTQEALAEVNGLGGTKNIAGRSILIPAKESDERPAATKTDPVLSASAEKGVFKKYYTVKKGDTLASVSKKFNVSSKILVAWNNLKNKLALSPGKKIIVAKYVEKKGAMVPADKS